LHRLRSSGYHVSLALVLCPGFTVRFHVFFTAAVFVTAAVTVALSSGDLLPRGRYQSLERGFLTIVESVRRCLPCIVMLRPDEKYHHLLLRLALFAHSFAVSILL
jgi:hypothetical protein